MQRFKRSAIAFFLVILLLSTACSAVKAVESEQAIDVNRVLEKEAVTGQKVDFASNAFTVAVRVKFLEQGGEVKAAEPSRGMIFAVASGYYDGIRAWYSWDSNSICFEIGRVPEQSSISVTKNEVPPLILHDLVCSYDGKTMKIFLNGKLAAEKEYVGKLDSKGAPLKAGFVHYGIGWSKMFVEKLEYYPRAWTEKEVAQRYLAHPAKEKNVLDLLEKFRLIYGTTNLDNSSESIQTLINLGKEYKLGNEAFETEYRRRLLASDDKADRMKALPILEKEAEEFLKTPKPAEDQTDRYNKFVSDLYDISNSLKDLYKSTGNRRLAALEHKLRAAFPYEMKILRKTGQLQSQMLQRAQKLEADSLARFEKFRSAPQDASAIYMAPNGSDTNDGSQNKPLATLGAALQKADLLAQKGTSVVINVGSGQYPCEKSAELVNTSKSGKTGQSSDLRGSILVRGAENDRPVFTGKVTLSGFAAVTDPNVLNRFEESVRDKIVCCDLKKNGITDFGAVTARGYPIENVMNPWTDLYVDGNAQTLARWPNEGEELLPFGEVIKDPNAVAEGQGKRTESNTFRYEYNRPEKWQLFDKPEENDIWANGLFQWEWAGDTRKVLNIDRKNKLLSVDYNNISGKFHYYLLNILEELDVPGEFYIDRKSGILYFYPPKGLDLKKADGSAKVELSVFNGPFVKLSGVSKLVFQNIVFTGCRTTAFWAEKSTDCYLDQCLIDGTGVHAVVMNRCAWSGVFHSCLKRLGGCGVRLYGGDRTSLTPSGLTIHDTEIATFCQVDRAYAAAIQTGGCGMTATNNLIYDSPHHALRMDGNDQYCARNEVHSVVYEFSDQSGIDIYCDPMYRGIVIEKNFWHHIGSSLALCGQAGIRLDDSISGVVMNDNIFYRSSGGNFGGIQIHGGKDNLCVGNLFLCCKKAFSFSPWGNDRYLRDFIHGHYGTNVKNYLEKKIYPFVDEDLEKNINRNFIFNNEMINCETFQTNGTRWDVFAGNKWKTVSSAPTNDGSIPTPQALRQWIEKISGRSLKEIGLTRGQNTIRHFVSPHYTEK